MMRYSLFRCETQMIPHSWHMRVFIIGLVAAVGSSCVVAADISESNSIAANQFFLERIRPLLASRCVSCHGADKAEGGLRLDSREAALNGGDSGPALVPGNPDESLILMAVKHAHKVMAMPPKDKLSSQD